MSISPEICQLFSPCTHRQDPKELVRKWQRQIRTEIRGVERQMLGTH